jgi:hypothetical protein
MRGRLLIIMYAVLAIKFFPFTEQTHALWGIAIGCLCVVLGIVTDIVLDVIGGDE